MQASSEFGVELLTFEKRAVGLVDIDHTLAYSLKGGELIPNEKLLDALKSKGIMDLYLFTDMTVSKESIKDRLKLIKILKERGFIVHGVITPLDYFWDFDQESIKSLDEKFYRSRVIMKVEAPRNLDLIEKILPEFPEIHERVTSNLYPKYGQAFAEAETAYKLRDEAKKNEVMAKLFERSLWCKNAIDAIIHIRKFPSSKAIMMLQFLSHFPIWVSAIKVLDDREENIDAVNVASKLLPPPVSIETYHGSFDEKGDTFAAQVAPELFITPDNSAELMNRIEGIATNLQQNIKLLMETDFFGGVRHKKEFSHAEAFYKKIMATERNFSSLWVCVLAHLRAITKNRSDNYQPTSFDNKLINALRSDALICEKISAMKGDSSEINFANEIARADIQQFLQLVLSEAVPSKGRLNKEIPKKAALLSQSMSNIPALKARHSSVARFAEKNLKSGENESQAKLLSETRKRSLSAGAASDLNVLKSSGSLPRAPHSSANESPDSSQDPGDQKDNIGINANPI